MTTFDSGGMSLRAPADTALPSAGDTMTDLPALFDRAQALKDAESALVEARRLRQEQQLENQSTLTRVLPYRPTDFEVVVDAVLTSIAKRGVHLTVAEAHTAAAWYTGDLRDDDVNELALAERLETAS